MPVNDPIADLLTRLRNALTIGRPETILPASGVLLGVCEALLREGFIGGFELLERPTQNAIRVRLKYGPHGERVIRGLHRESRPGRRLYRGVKKLEPLLRGMGCYIVSTPQGILSDREARARKVGGEVLCSVW